jgi:hypothetical protein
MGRRPGEHQLSVALQRAAHAHQLEADDRAALVKSTGTRSQRFGSMCWR